MCTCRVIYLYVLFLDFSQCVATTWKRGLCCKFFYFFIFPSSSIFELLYHILYDSIPVSDMTFFFACCALVVCVFSRKGGFRLVVRVRDHAAVRPTRRAEDNPEGRSEARPRHGMGHAGLRVHFSQEGLGPRQVQYYSSLTDTFGATLGYVRNKRWLFGQLCHSQRSAVQVLL